MKKFSRFIVKNQKLIIVFYSALVLISLIAGRFVSIEYDLSSYLPKSMNSIMGKEKLQSEFTINGSATLMIKSNDINYILEIKKSIVSIPGIKEAIWLDDVEDVKKPLEFFDKKLSKRFISGEYSLLQIQFTESNDALITREALDKVNKLIDKEHYFGGPAAISKDMQDTTSKEMIYYSVVAFLIITIILLISTNAYYEPILFFVTIGVAIVLNAGTNIIFGKISSNTNSVSSILQLAVSMDYSIFLLHRFHEENKDGNKNEAMARAIEKTFSSVSSSALTTVCGFLALLWMNYGIGKDMGLVLAKGVFFSLVAVVTLMPCLILAVDEKLGKYKHKAYMPGFEKISGFMVKSRVVTLIIAALIVAPTFLGQSKLEYYYSTEKTLSESSKSAIANEKIQQVFGKSNELILIIPKEDKIKINNLIEEIKTVENVDAVQGLYSMVDPTLPGEIIPKEVKETFESEKFTYMIINLLSSTEGKGTTKAIEEIRRISSEYYSEWYLTGEAAVYLDLQAVTSKDFLVVNNVSILLIGIILLITFKSIGIPILLVFAIQLGIWINLSIPYFQGISLNFISFIIIGAIQLGATVDYAILVTSRYKENLQVMPPIPAMIKTIGDTGKSVLTSALILVAGTLSISFITTIRSASELTLLIGRGALISLFIVYTVLPALLVTFNWFIKATTIGWPKTIKMYKSEEKREVV
ncbi:efflux RND transporter permease subunit [Clostridium tunisiense]|uniref:efflux RND transporter permease subunit n=1 Tax=Clostridium tunisiense TaxID=219748 RepID=UPI0002DB1E37|nr:MMPL family transporter [Clostridium tunisiense]